VADRLLEGGRADAHDEKNKTKTDSRQGQLATLWPLRLRRGVPSVWETYEINKIIDVGPGFID
jgi:hypothetical protein